MTHDVVTAKTTLDFQLELDFKIGGHRRFEMRQLLALRPWNRIASEMFYDESANLTPT